MFPAGLLANLRPVHEMTLTQSCVHSADREEELPAGGTRKAPVVIGIYPCRVTRAGSPPVERLEGGVQQVQSVRKWEVKLPLRHNGQPVRVDARDRLTVDGVTYLVEGTDSGRTDALHLVATCVVAE
jgi:hypothetical protein